MNRYFFGSALPSASPLNRSQCLSPLTYMGYSFLFLTLPHLQKVSYLFKSKGFASDSSSSSLPLPPRSSVASVRPRPCGSASVSGSARFLLRAKSICLQFCWGQLRLRRHAARLSGFGLAAPCECDYCVLIIEKPLELGVHKIKPGY